MKKDRIPMRAIMNNIRQIIIIISIISLCFLLHDCGFIKICWENKYSIKKSSKYFNLTGVSVDELKQIIKADTLNYKVLIFYSPCCGPCIQHFKTTYKTAYKKLDSVNFYFINSDCGGLKYIESFLSDFTKNEKKYYIKDTSANFNTKNIHRLNNILNYIFDESGENKITGVFGIPTSCIVNKNNQLKKTKCTFVDNSTPKNIPLALDYLEDFYNYNLDLIDFNVIDTSNTIHFDFCTPDGCKVK